MERPDHLFGHLDVLLLAAGRALLLRVTGHGLTTHQFLISLERTISEAKADAPILAFKDAQRETGEVLVEGPGTIELTAIEAGGL